MMLRILLVVTLCSVFAIGNFVNVSEGVPVRLVNGNGVCSGRVEVYIGHQWGAVCDRTWSLLDAEVVCRELSCGWATATPPGDMFAWGRGTTWLKIMQCFGYESSLGQCSTFRIWNPISDRACTHKDNAGVECSGKLEKPTLSLQSSHFVYSPGEAACFRCTANPSPYMIVDFHLIKEGAGTPLVSQGAGSAQTGVMLTLSDLDASNQGSYSCLYTIRAELPLSSPQSNYIYITVVELHTPEIWYNTSLESTPGRVVRGQGFNITCSTQQPYPGSSFQLRLVRSNGTVRQSVPALAPSVTFTFLEAQSSLEGYYYCLYRVQLGGRVFTSRESQPLPISVRDPEPLLNPMVVSWLVSGITFIVALVVILLVVWVHCQKKEKLTQLERDSRTCVNNTYVVLPVE